MAGVVGRGDRVHVDAAIAFHRWRAAAARAAARIPDGLRERAWVLFEPFESSTLGARVSRVLGWAGLVVPVAILGYGFATRQGVSVWTTFTRWGISGLVAMYAFFGLDAVRGGIAWVFAVWLPRRGVRRAAALAKVEVDAIGLALSPRLLSELPDEEVRQRALCWMLLDAEAQEQERLGEAAGRLLKRGVAPHPAELEMVLSGRRSAAVGLYWLGLVYLWWPLFRIGVPGWMRLPAPEFPWWPASAIALFAVAWLFHAVSGAALRYWLGCEPRPAGRLGHHLAHLWRARYLRKAALALLTDVSASALLRAERNLFPALPEPPPAGVLAKLKSWLFADE